MSTNARRSFIAPFARVAAALLLLGALASASSAADPAPGAPGTPGAPAAIAPPSPNNPMEIAPTPGPKWLAGYKLRYPLLVVGDPEKAVNAKGVMASIPTGGWLRPDAGDLAVQTADGQAIPVNILSSCSTGDTIIQFKRNGNDRWYWVYLANPSAPGAKGDAIPEGMVVEFRDWAGDKLDSWATVVEGLKKSDNVIGNAMVTEVIQNSNPFRPTDPRNFAASYRGYFNVPAKAVGSYRFMANADDAAFLFIDGLKVFDRPGTNMRLTGSMPVHSAGKDIELAEGVHPLEVHHVMGNSPAATGVCSLLWVPPAARKLGYVPRDSFVQGLTAMPGGVEHFSGEPAAAIQWGIDDALTSGGINVYIARFEASGARRDDKTCLWDMGDGTTRTGGSVHHVYFRPGRYVVTLKSNAGLPLAKRSIFIWPTPVTSNPLSLSRAIKALETTDWRKFDAEKIDQAFAFLLVTEQPERWPLIEEMARHIITKVDLDPQTRASAIAALMQAMGQLGKAKDAVKLLDPALREFAKLPSQQITVALAAAEVYYQQLKDPEEASRVYDKIVTQNRRLDVPELRQAAVKWGDMLADSGDLSRAAEVYRLAASLAPADETAVSGDLATKGALLRVAEQKLRAGDLAETRRMLTQIETNYPEQKLEGLYRFLRAEADRTSGMYERAARGYEAVLRMPQWAGYRDRALFGLADTALRMGELDRCLEWLAAIKKNYAASYDKMQLAVYQQVVESRRDKALAVKAAQTQPDNQVAANLAEASAPFAGFHTGFEASEKQLFATARSFVVTPGSGIDGPNVGLYNGTPAPTGQVEYNRQFRNVTSNGWYWVEFWYRETLGAFAPGVPHSHCWFYGVGNSIDPAGTGTLYLERTYGQWRKLGYKLRAPVTPDGTVVFSMRAMTGIFEIDGLQVLPVTDRQNDAMAKFTEGVFKP
ncbi:MAG: PKD domain-containing protein [Planctomycetota bacterium]|nr:PKD domain-containing protein [Planctomycetota bacterium]